MYANGLSAFTEFNPDEVGELTEAERARLEHLEYLKTEQSGYVMIQITRPQTLAHGLHDSPVGQLAWIVEEFKEWTDPAELPEDAVDRDLLLTNVMLGFADRHRRAQPTATTRRACRSLGRE